MGGRTACLKFVSTYIWVLTFRAWDAHIKRVVENGSESVA